MQVFSAPFREVNAGSASRAPVATGSNAMRGAFVSRSSRPEIDVQR